MILAKDVADVVFRKYNANPKSKMAGDCVVRAISVATGMTWADVYKSLVEIGLKYGYMPNEKATYKRFLESQGYKMQKMPKRENGKRYTVAEFINELADPHLTYVVEVAKHTTCVNQGVLVDTWNCGYKSVYNYWIIED